MSNDRHTISQISFGGFSCGFSSLLAATDSSNFFRQIKTKNAAIEHTKLNKHSRFIWWGKLQQQQQRPRGRRQRSLAENYKKIVQLLFAQKGMKSRNAAAAATAVWQQLWQAAGVSSGFSSISRAEDFPTNLNVTCEQISTRSSIHSAPTHTHTHRETYRHCHIVWQHDATAVLATPCPQVLRDFSLFLPIGHKRPSSQQSMANLQHATCNRQAGSRTFNAECRTPKFGHLVTFVLSDFQPNPKPKIEIRKLKTEK